MRFIDELKKEEGKIRITINIDKELIRKIDEIKDEFGLKSRSYTINKLMWLILRQIEREKRRHEKRKQKHNPVEQYRTEEQRTVFRQEHSLKEQKEEEQKEQQNRKQFLEHLINPFASLDVGMKKNER